MLTLLLGFAGAGSLAYLGICSALLLWQNRLIFLPQEEIKQTPKDINLGYEEVWLPVTPAEKIHAWWLPATVPQADVILYFHGNGCNIGGRVQHIQKFHRLGFNIFIIDYRGYGRSQGKFPTEKQVYQDAETAWQYLIQQRGIKPNNILLYGHSLGGAIAIDLAAKHSEIAGLVIEGSFTSMRQMVNYIGKYQIFPVDWLLTHKFDSMSKIKSLQMPLLFIHGTEDRIVPAHMSQTLYQQAVAPKQLWEVVGGKHNDIASVSGEEYEQTISNFYQLVQNHRLNQNLST